MYHEKPKMIETHSATAPILPQLYQPLYQHHLHTGKAARRRDRSHVKRDHPVGIGVVRHLLLMIFLVFLRLMGRSPPTGPEHLPPRGVMAPSKFRLDCKADKEGDDQSTPKRQSGVLGATPSQVQSVRLGVEGV
jgi:hypothetical protein